MAIKGLGYTKTTWSFEERPVASSKLNLWDDRIEAALELAFRLLHENWGDADGVVRGATATDLQVVATEPAGLSVSVGAGYAFISGCPVKLAQNAATGSVTPPATTSRIDLVQLRLATWDVAVKTGAESASPVAPSVDSDCLALAQLHLRAGMTSIKDSDDALNGYIVDVRAFL